VGDSELRDPASWCSETVSPRGGSVLLSTEKQKQSFMFFSNIYFSLTLKLLLTGEKDSLLTKENKNSEPQQKVFNIGSFICIAYGIFLG
jgi:hypothetical protein